MNCIYDAYIDHLNWLDIDPDPLWDISIYEILKRHAHGTTAVYTSGAIVPWLFDNLRDVHDLDMEIQYRLWTPVHYIADADNIFIKDIAKRHFYGQQVDKITLAPAIYCLLAPQHAVFALDMPKTGVPVMAIALYDNDYLDYTEYY